MSDGPAPRVVVLGAGLAGLAAAHALARRSIDVTLLEARSAEDDAAAGLACCAVPARSPALHGLALELGLGERVRSIPLQIALGGWQELAAAANPRREPRELLAVVLARASSAIRAPLEAVRGHRLRALLQRYAPALDPREPERAAALDDRSAADFCRLYLGSGPLARRLQAGLELGFGLDPAELSRVALLLLLDPWGELGAGLPLGLRALRDGLAGPLKDLRHGVRVRGIRADAREVWLESGECIRADAVVLASDPAEASRLVDGLGPGERLALEGLRSLDALRLRVRVGALRAGPASPETPGVVRGIAGRPDGPLAGILDWTPLEPGAAESGSRSWLLRARPGFAARAAQGSDAEAAAALLAAGEQLCPGLLARAEGHELERAPGAQPMLRVGCYRAAERLAREAAARPGRPLFAALAGLAGGHPEAALAAGLRAAEACALRIRSARS